MIRAIIVDDEELARDVIKEFLINYPSIQVVGECDNGQDAILTIDSEKPDLVFLDIQMPELNGFEVLEHLDHIPVVVFSTAYDQYAIRAFEVNAVDYLLKPYSPERFAKAISRVEALMVDRSRSNRQILSLLKELRRINASTDRLLIKDSHRIRVINTDDIDWLEAQGDYVGVHIGDKTHLVQQRLKDLRTRLNPEQFVRIHRSSIVNFDRIEEMQSLGDGRYKVILKDGTELVLSRSAAKNLSSKLIR